MIKKILGFSMSTWIGAIITLLIAPIASHIYMPDELGVINYYYSINNIVFTILLMGMDQAYIRVYSEMPDLISKKRLFTYNILSTIAIVIVVFVICIPIRQTISLWVVGHTEVPVILLMLAHIVGLVIVRYYVIAYRLEGNLVLFTLSSIINTILLKVAYIFAAPFSLTSNSAIIVTAIVTVVASALFLILGRKKLAFAKIRLDKAHHLDEWRFALPIMPTMVIAILNNNLPQIVIRSFSGFENIAVYSIGLTLASTITLLHNGVNTFIEPYIYNNYQTKHKEISNMLSAFVRVSVFLGIGLSVFQDLFFLLFSRSYYEVTQFLPILISSALWMAIGDFYNIGVKIAKKTQDNIPIYAIGIAANLLMSVLLIPRYENMGASISAAVASFIMCVIKKRRGNKYYPIEEKKSLFAMGSILLIISAILNYMLWNTRGRMIAMSVLWIASFFLLELHKYIRMIVLRIKRNRKAS